VAIDSPGLMNGLAGIGYALLRLAEPERVPSVLTLAPPVQGAWRHR
jgi:lantibiotic modifying enzyme